MRGAHRTQTLVSTLLVSVLLVGQLICSSPSWGWVLEGHRQIALDALAVLPPPTREVFARHLSALVGGVVEPDVNRVVSHKIPIVSLWGTPQPPRSGAASEVNRLAVYAQKMLRLGPSPDEARYADMTIRLGGMDDVLFVVGQATHFVEDLNQPLHAAWGETRAEHNEVEAQMIYRSWQKDHTYRGFVLVKNYGCFAYEIAEISAQYARPLFFDREIKRVTELAWDQAVNDTANLWQSIFWNGLGREQAWQLYGIPAPVGEIRNGCR